MQQLFLLLLGGGFPLGCCLAAAQEHGASGTCHAAPRLAEPRADETARSRVMYGEMTQLPAGCGHKGLLH